MANQNGREVEVVIRAPDPYSGDAARLHQEGLACATLIAALLTILAVFAVLLSLDKLIHCRPKVSIESISFSSSSDPPSSTIWIVDFSVKNPNFRCPLYYDGDYVSVKVGPLYGAVLNISDKGHKGFSIAFATKASVLGPNDNDLNIILRGRHYQFVDLDEAGHFDVLCRNLTAILLPDSMLREKKIECHSSFKWLE